jgi:hypothetical protein
MRQDKEKYNPWEATTSRMPACEKYLRILWYNFNIRGVEKTAVKQD